jgi:deazaflavin-dependent oxidoreductase (nitroreductase family)
VNPVVRGLLRSPAHRLMSGSVLLLGYTGRRSGRSFELPVQYAVDGDALVVAAGQPEQKSWWRNFGTDPRLVTLTVRGQRCRGTARRPAPDDPDRQRALRAYARAAPRVPLGATTPVLVITPLDGRPTTAAPGAPGTRPRDGRAR